MPRKGQRRYKGWLTEGFPGWLQERLDEREWLAVDLAERLGANSGAITFFAWPGAPRGNYGIGGTHHVAYATANSATLRQWKRYLTDNGVPVTGPYDRVYFESD